MAGAQVSGLSSAASPETLEGHSARSAQPMLEPAFMEASVGSDDLNPHSGDVFHVAYYAQYASCPRM